MIKQWKKGWILVSLLSLAVMLCFLVEWKEEKEAKLPVRPVMLRLAEPMPSDHPSAHAAQLFAQLIRERSQGRIRIQVYDNARLGMPGEILEQVQFGGIGAARVSALDLAGADTEIETLFAPGRFASPQKQIEWIQYNRELLEKRCRELGFTPLIWYYPDYRCFYSRDTKIQEASDLRGLKIQAVPNRMITGLLGDWGAETVEQTSLDPFKFFNSGNIDGAESAFGEFICCGYADYSRYVTLNTSLFFPDVILINTEVFESLGEEDRELIRVCAQATYAYPKSQMEELYRKWKPALSAETELELEEEEFQ